jgi:hypothetical protein
MSHRFTRKVGKKERNNGEMGIGKNGKRKRRNWETDVKGRGSVPLGFGVSAL